MATAIDGNLSKRINSLRFLLIVFVVIMHNGINEKIFLQRNINAIIPGYVENVQNLIGIITAVAVPLFFLIAGYLLYKKETKFVPVLKKKCRTILTPYILWHILLISFYLIVTTIPFTKQYFSPEKPISEWELFDWIKALFGDYSNKKSLINTPFVYWFWFLRDLFILNIFFVIIKKLVDKFTLPAFNLEVQHLALQSPVGGG